MIYINTATKGIPLGVLSTEQYKVLEHIGPVLHDIIIVLCNNDIQKRTLESIKLIENGSVNAAAITVKSTKQSKRSMDKTIEAAAATVKFGKPLNGQWKCNAPGCTYKNCNVKWLERHIQNHHAIVKVE